MTAYCDQIVSNQHMRLLKLALLVAFSAPNALAQSSASPSILPQNFAFAGSFDCVGAFGNGKTHKTVFTASTILNNTWIELTEQDVEPATGYLAKYLIGYDPQTKHFIEFDANNFGAAAYSGESGWQNNTLTLTSAVTADTKASYAANRFAYTITAPDTFTVTWQISRTAALDWHTADHFTCKRR